MIDEEKLAEILNNGGHIVMHKHDAQRLKEATQAGQRPEMFKGVKIIVDKTGMIEEGKPIATRPIGRDDGDHQSFYCRNLFNTKEQ